KDGSRRNLSEQHLISCNTHNWGCSGGWYAFGYYIGAELDVNASRGVVYAQSFPYQAADVACNAPYQHHEQLMAWHYVTPDAQRVGLDAVADLKHAIHTHGPVATTVCVGDAFSQYRGGIFSTDERNHCADAHINHGVVIVGWDDHTSTWIVRNSWGTQWGEQGYMRIRYGTSNIGYLSAYVVYEPNTPTELDSMQHKTYLPLVLR
ncbi:MAG: hypothetical protein EI684_23020, partial [Candidatus Viridilinea halotolerans]